MTSQVIDRPSVGPHFPSMHAYQLEKLGELSGLVLRERPSPTPGPGEIVVRVRSASLNKRDIFIMKGSYPLPSKSGVIPLSDGAGEVVQVGHQVSRFRVGDRVAGNYFAKWKSGAIEPEVFDQLGCALDGMLTEVAVLNEEWAVKVPDHLTWEQAATLPCAGVTAWNSMFGPVPIVAGQSVLVLGTGGVSMFALQFAKLAGARVIVVTSSHEKVARLTELGAEVVINSTENPLWGTAVRDASGGRGVDLVVETMGPDTIEQSMQAVAMHGQIMLLIARGVHRADIQISAPVYGKTMATIRRVFVGNRASFEAMNRAVAAARLAPIIDSVFPFVEAAAAFDYFMRSRSFGKVVISGA